MNANKEISDISSPNLKNWGISSRSQSRDLYALALVSREFTTVTTGGPMVGESGTASFSGLDSNYEFIFNVNPRAITFDEPATVQITPTQDGSQFIEHQGSLYKTITISGTTGLRPNKKGSDLIPIFDIPNPFGSTSVNTETGLPFGETSGFEDLIRLRNLFRMYYGIKRDPEIAYKYEMVWQNSKDGEFWVVEPLTFRSSREASSPLTTAYEIQLRTIRRADFRPSSASLDVRERRNSAARLNERLSGYNRQLATALSVMTALADRSIGIGQATLNSVILPATTLFNGLSEFITTTSRGFAMPRNSIAILANSALNVLKSLQTAKYEVNAYNQQGLSTQLSRLFKAYKDIFRIATRVHSENTIHAQSISSKYNNRVEAYRDLSRGSKLPITGGCPTNIANIAIPSGMSLVLVTSYDTIYSIAHKYLGNQTRWKELVILNDLKAPYISEDGDGKDVLRPNDSIMIPSMRAGNVNTILPNTLSDDDKVTQRLGRDIRLRRVDVNVAGRAVYDVIPNSKGDLARIEGIKNMEQAVLLKFSTEQGTLPTHPMYGIKAPIGSRVNIRSFVGFQLNVRSALLADARISKIQKLTFNVSGNVLYINTVLLIDKINQSVNVSFEVRK